MENLKNVSSSVGVTFLSGFVVLLAIGALFHNNFRMVETEMFANGAELRGYTRLLENRKAILDKWQAAHAVFAEDVSPEQKLNLWVKQLIAYAGDQGVVFEKLEPRKIRGSDHEMLGIFLSFKGDIRKLVRFLHGLTEKDPLTSIHGFVIAHEENSKALRYELTLTRTR